METMNGQDITITFKVKPAGPPPDDRGLYTKKRWKTPSQLRRDNARREKFIVKKREETQAEEKVVQAVLVEPTDEINNEEIEKELCEKVFVIPRHKIDNHNIGIEYDVTEKLEARGIKVKQVRVERTGGLLSGDFARCDVTLEPTDVALIEKTKFGIVNCCVLPYT